MSRAAGASHRTTQATRAALLGAVVTALWTSTAHVATQELLDVTLFARAAHPGEVVRLDVACPCVAAPLVKGLGAEIPLSPAGEGRWQGLLGIDLDTTPGVYPLQVLSPVGAATLVRELTLDVQPKQFPTRTLRVAPRYVEPPADETARIVREAEALDRLFKRWTPRAWTGAFILPIEATPTSNFGSRSIFNGQPRSPHAGVDFSSPRGTPVRAPAAGIVVLASDLFFTGNTVVLDHGAGVVSVFAHLSSTTVQPGESVSEGAPLGLVGATGRATGPHLHWSVRLHGSRVDPLSVVATTQADAPQLAAHAPRPAPR
jgi:murein DD-endopeptidase MepM/ murein hydrolase activator NlpD